MSHAQAQDSARELAHKRSHIEAAAYGECRDIDEREAFGEVSMDHA